MKSKLRNKIKNEMKIRNEMGFRPKGENDDF